MRYVEEDECGCFK